MSNCDDFHKMSAIVNRIKDSIITNADPPFDSVRRQAYGSRAGVGHWVNDLKAWIARTRITPSSNLTSFFAERASLTS